MRAVLSLLVCLTLPAFGQSVLPPCDANAAVASWTNCQGKATLKYGNEYVGEFKNGRQHGQGTQTWPSGIKYVGEFRDGNYHGQGTNTWVDGRKYVGEWRNNARHGQGIQTYPNGKPPEEGIWENNNLVRAQSIPDHIAGRTSNPPLAQAPRQAESVSQGSVQSALPPCDPKVGYWNWTNCKGTANLHYHGSGANYVGEFKDGSPNGQGTLIFGQMKYVGEFRDGEPHGQGTATWGRGDKYVGEWRGGKRQSRGIHTYADGRPPEEGIWYNDRLVRAQSIPDHIAGRTSNPPLAQAPRQAESVSQGSVQSALPPCETPLFDSDNWTNCEGTWSDGAGTKYVGGFKDGKRHGQGTLTFASGDSYVGEWRGGKRHGQGTDISDGEKYVGEFRDNKRHGQGIAIYKSGNKYVGQFKDGMRHGKGSYTYADGRRPPEEGDWWDDRFGGTRRIPDHIAGGERPLAKGPASAKEKLLAGYEYYMFVQGCYDVRKGYQRKYIDESTMREMRSRIKEIESDAIRSEPSIDAKQAWSDASVKYKANFGEMIGVAKMAPDLFHAELMLLCRGAVSNLGGGSTPIPKKDF